MNKSIDELNDLIEKLNRRIGELNMRIQDQSRAFGSDSYGALGIISSLNIAHLQKANLINEMRQILKANLDQAVSTIEACSDIINAINNSDSDQDLLDLKKNMEFALEKANEVQAKLRVLLADLEGSDA